MYVQVYKLSLNVPDTGLRRRSAAARLLRLRVRVITGAWMSVCRECCVLSGGGLFDELIIRPEESFRLWWVVVSDIETSGLRGLWPSGGCRVPAPKKTSSGRFLMNSKMKHIDFIKVS